MWCRGVVKVVIESAKREPIIGVHYIGFDSKKDEIVQKDSRRLAKAGSYTARRDIPTYRVLSDPKRFELINQAR